MPRPINRSVRGRFTLHRGSPATLGPPVSVTAQPDGTPAGSTTIGTWQSGHGWTTSGVDASSNTNDTTTFVRGTQSAKIVTDGLGGNALLRRSGLSINTTGTRMQVLVLIDKVHNLKNATGNLSVALYSGGQTVNGLRFNLVGPPSGQAEVRCKDGIWWLFDVPLRSVVGNHVQAIGTGAIDMTAITNIDCRLIDDATTKVTCNWQMLAFRTQPAIATVSVCFDDGWVSTSSIAKPYMDTYGYKGSLFLINEYTDTNVNYLTSAQLAGLASGGWDIGGHANTAAMHASTWEGASNDAALLADITAQRTLHFANGWDVNDAAYPQGEFWGGQPGYTGTITNDTYANALASYTLIRTINKWYMESLPPPMRGAIPCYDVTNVDTATTLQAVIDLAIADKSWLPLTFHQLVASAPGADQFLTSDFQTVMDYLRTKELAGVLQVKNFSAVRASI